jgi:hypothetical protein
MVPKSAICNDRIDTITSLSQSIESDSLLDIIRKTVRGNSKKLGHIEDSEIEHRVQHWDDRFSHLGSNRIGSYILSRKPSLIKLNPEIVEKKVRELSVLLNIQYEDIINIYLNKPELFERSNPSLLQKISIISFCRSLSINETFEDIKYNTNLLTNTSLGLFIAELAKNFFDVAVDARKPNDFIAKFENLTAEKIQSGTRLLIERISNQEPTFKIDFPIGFTELINEYSVSDKSEIPRILITRFEDFNFLSNNLTAKNLSRKDSFSRVVRGTSLDHIQIDKDGFEITFSKHNSILSFSQEETFKLSKHFSIDNHTQNKIRKFVEGFSEVFNVPLATVKEILITTPQILSTTLSTLRNNAIQASSILGIKMDDYLGLCITHKNLMIMSPENMSLKYNLLLALCSNDHEYVRKNIFSTNIISGHSVGSIIFNYILRDIYSKSGQNPGYYFIMNNKEMTNSTFYGMHRGKLRVDKQGVTDTLLKLVEILEGIQYRPSYWNDYVSSIKDTVSNISDIRKNRKRTAEYIRELKTTLQKISARKINDLKKTSIKSTSVSLFTLSDLYEENVFHDTLEKLSSSQKSQFREKLEVNGSRIVEILPEYEEFIVKIISLRPQVLFENPNKFCQNIIDSAKILNISVSDYLSKVCLHSISLVSKSSTEIGFGFASSCLYHHSLSKAKEALLEHPESFRKNINRFFATWFVSQIQDSFLSLKADPSISIENLVNLYPKKFVSYKASAIKALEYLDSYDCEIRVNISKETLSNYLKSLRELENLSIKDKKVKFVELVRDIIDKSTKDRVNFTVPYIHDNTVTVQW